jgi:RNA polymerase sigma-70 factor (ECF subfamily)
VTGRRRRDRAHPGPDPDPGPGPGPGPGDDPDGLLLLRSRTDPGAFGEFYDRNHQGVLRWFMSQTRDPHLAGELTAETFAQALSSVHGYRLGRGSGVGWLYGIAANQHRRLLRRGEVDRRYRDAHRIPTLTKSEDDLERIEATADLAGTISSLHGALAGLSPAVRAAVELRVGHDLPYSEVARRLGCTVGSARVRVARGLKQLMAAMGVEGST